MRTQHGLGFLVLALLTMAAALPAGADTPGAPAPSTRAILNALAAAGVSVSASDSLYEDRVEVLWPNAGAFDVFYRVLRTGGGSPDTTLLSVLSSEDSTFTDVSGDPGAEYRYIVRVVDVAADTVLDVGSDPGSRRIHPPGNVSATDGTLSTRVRVTWSDVSLVEAGYRILRRSSGVGAFAEIGTVAGDVGVFDDPTAVPGTTYDYRVLAFDAEGFTSRAGEDAGWAGFVVPPASVRATDGTFGDRVRITWADQSPDETGFAVYRNGNRIATVGLDGTGFDDTDSLGTAHVYAVAAVIDTGGTALESVRVPDAGIGGPGTLAGADSLAATVDVHDDRVHLAWNDGSGAEDSWIVERDGERIALLRRDTESFDDPDAEPGKLYAYAVYAEADSGGTSPKVTDSGRRAVVLAPTQVAASDGTYEGYVNITWESAATSVVLFKILRNGVAFRTVGGTARSAVDTDVAPGATRTYCVVAVTPLDQSSPSGCDTGFRRLKAPTGVAASDDAYEDRVLVTWEDNSRAETGYRVYRRPAGQGAFALLGTRGAGRTAYVDTAAAPGTAYEYEVAAADDLGESERARDGGRRLLAAPTEVAASDGAFETRVAVSWLDNSRFETGYEIRRKAAGSASAPDSIGRVGPNTMRYEDTAIGFGIRYEYTVVPFDALGYSPAGAADAGYSTILPPLSVNASDRHADRVVLTWVDESAIETGYRIERRTLGSSAGATVLKTVAAGVETFRDSTAAAGVEYEYCVRTVSGAVLSDPACDDGVFRIPVAATGTVLDAFLKPASPAAGAGLGTAVAMSGDRVMAGAPGLSTAGRVVCFARTTTGWEQTQVLVPPETLTGFGRRVAMDGDYAMVSADNFYAYVYQFKSGSWTYYGKVFGVQHGMALGGTDLALCYTTQVVPANLIMRGVSVYSLDGKGGIVFERQMLSPSQDEATRFGEAMAFGEDELNIGAPGLWAGFNVAAVWTYYRDGNGDWPATTGYYVSNPAAGFGSSVTVDGANLLVGSPTEGKVYYFNNATYGSYVQTGSSSSPGSTGFGAAVGLWGRYAVVGVPAGTGAGAGPGRVEIVEQNGDGTWPAVAAVRLESATGTTGDDFGRSVAVSKGSLVFGGPADDVDGSGSGSVVVYDLHRAPAQVVASDGTFADRIQVKWQDRSTLDTQEDGFNVYRDGVLLETTSPDIRTYNDYEAEPGRAHVYAVASLRGGAESERVPDSGRRAPNGAITGRVETLSGAAVNGVAVCLDPTPNGALLFDGSGKAVSDPVDIRGNHFTLEFWVNTGDLTGNAKWIELRNLSDIQIATGPFIVGTSSGVAYVSAVSPFGAPQTQSLSSLTLAENRWYHIALVVNVANNILCYVDGQLQATLTVAAEDQGRRAVHLGGFQGRLDDVRIWGTQRTAAQIQGLRGTPLTGAEDGLRAYWKLDEDAGGLAADLAPGQAYAALGAGAYWSRGGAPLTACAATDLEGNYALTELRYGESTTFRVMPQLPNRVFEPGFKTITLSTGAPVQNEVAFRDISSYTVNGFVRFANVSLDPDAFCLAGNVEILVDGEVKGTTDANGSFSVAATMGRHVIQPRFKDHTFSPATLAVDIAADTSGVQFTDTTVRTVAGRMGGGCDLDIGSLQIEIVSENGCFAKDDLTANGDYELRLPPQVYFLTVRDVKNIPAGLDKADILQFFEDLGTRRIDLAAADTTLDFVYRAPIRVRITGFDPPVCATPPRNVPVLAQGDQAALTIEVFEDYGPGRACPVDSATVVVYDEIIDEADQPVLLTVENGVASYTTIANTPNVFAGRRDSKGIDRSYQKPITAVADVGGIFASATDWVIVTGQRPRVPTFTSTTEEFPLLILRDPPGDNSFATLEQGTTTCTEIHDVGLEQLSAKANLELKTGVKFEKGTPFFTTETKAYLKLTGEFEIGMEATQDDGLNICVSTTEAFSTSSNELFTGEGGDVYLGVAMNLVFAKTDVVEFDPNTCVITKSEAVTVGGDGLEPFETTYLYTADHIRNVVIPQLRALAAAATNPDSAALFTSYADNWQSNHLDYNALLKQLALTVENRSFSAGAEYTATASTDTTETFTWTVKTYTDDKASLGFIFEESGNGAETNFVVGLKVEYTRAEGSATTNSRTVAYTLADDDIGDFFSIDIKEDINFGTPIFDVVSGTSSCPWEPWYNATGEPRMQPRDTAVIGVEPPELRDVPPEDAAVFTLSLSNDSQSGESREYLLRPIQTSNPGGATLRVNGVPLNGEMSFFIGAQQTQEVTLLVERGPRRYLYEDLLLQLVSPCEYDRWRTGGPLPLADTVSVTVEFDAPCSEVSLFRPRSGWIHNAADGDSLEIILNDFELRISEDDSIQSVGAEYRLLNTDLWRPIREVPRGNLPTDVEGNPQSLSIRWGIAGLAQEGRYEIRGFTRCAGGSNTSNPVTGLLDRTPPVPFGAPQPADSVLSLGEEIQVTFPEAILCESLNAAAVTLVRLNADQTTTPVQVGVACDGNSVILTPAGLAQLEGRTLIASLTGVKDLAGNPMTARNGSSTETWSFEVRRSAFTWAQGALVKEVAYRAPGAVAATLVNGTAEDLDVLIEDAPAWLVPQPAGARILKQQSLKIAFAVDGGLALGSHQATVRAVVRDGQGQVVRETPLLVQLEVVCAPPVWSLDPAAFEQSMTVVAQVNVGGQLSDDPHDRIAAFVGNQLRGVASPVFVAGLNKHLVFLTVYGNRASGESVRFQVYDDSECRLYPASNRSLAFTAEGSLGTPDVPELIVAQDAPAASVRQIAAGEGWTWVSFNLRAQDMSVNGVLDDLNPAAGDLVKSQTAFSQFDPNLGWTGGVATVTTTAGYLLKLSEAGTIAVEGSPAPPDSTPIPVGNGWNWIAYVPQAPMAVDVALAGLSPTNDDVIKGQHGFAQYFKQSNNVKGWYGTLQVMEPGRGYKLKLKNATNSGNVLRYPLPPAGPSGEPLPIPAFAEAGVGPAADGPDWSVDARAYQYNMTVTAAVELDGGAVRGTDLVLAAFVGEEIRGVATLREIPGLPGSRAFLMIHSNVPEGEDVSFRIHDPAAGHVLAVEDGVTFSADEVLGDLGEPWVVAASSDAVLDGPGAGARTFALFRVRPNPLTGAAAGTIRFTLPGDEHVVLRLFDVQGRVIRTLLDEPRRAGDHEVLLESGGLPAGIYFFTLQAGGFRDAHRVVVLN